MSIISKKFRVIILKIGLKYNLNIFLLNKKIRYEEHFILKPFKRRKVSCSCTSCFRFEKEYVIFYSKLF